MSLAGLHGKASGAIMVVRMPGLASPACDAGAERGDLFHELPRGRSLKASVIPSAVSTIPLGATLEPYGMTSTPKPLTRNLIPVAFGPSIKGSSASWESGDGVDPVVAGE
ncbi:hypothetical protein FOJ82_08050 [Tessaracoccus rhinocerotis]|uniref:Uncharacterized protein n=1 Tax=Tessaracoccus rhinocerotis TaxID=1689449 RepID=A0A553K2V2_9ACTN|nr:hypothetical protein [Tessaracoccus rhinocerotis]TRY19040.1 hypothetical protein FOJ82_08050 [Tessaracoccus rhinocerotis]